MLEWRFGKGRALSYILKALNVCKVASRALVVCISCFKKHAKLAYLTIFLFNHFSSL